MSPGSRDNPSTEQWRLAVKRPALWIRAKVIQAIRGFFIQNGYLEVETPFLIPAPAPELHIDAIQAGGEYLHTSPELCMKRLLSAGYSKIFQICACFRQAERGSLHLPQFTLLEWYRSHCNYLELMEECEEMVRSVSIILGVGEKIKCHDHEVNLKGPWEKMTVREAFLQYASLSLDEALRLGRFDETMVEEIEPFLGLSKPVFLYDYPVSLAALARVKASDPDMAERFELYIKGWELANAFSELTDHQEQEARFTAECEHRRRMGKKVYPIPEKFLRALPFMPPSAGIALGVDRLVMLFADKATIDGVVPFTPEEL